MSISTALEDVLPLVAEVAPLAGSLLQASHPVAALLLQAVASAASNPQMGVAAFLQPLEDEINSLVSKFLAAKIQPPAS